MTTVAELIEAHRAALSKFQNIVSEQNRLEGLEAMSRQCEVDSLLAQYPGTGSIYGDSEDDLRQKLEDIYHEHGLALLWLERHRKDIYAEMADLLDDLRAKNRTFVAPAFEAWQKDRQQINKKLAEYDVLWQEANVVEAAAAVALLRHPAATREEEAQRAAYVRETKIMMGAPDHYSDALLQSFLTAQEPEYIPSKAYIEFEQLGL